MRKVSVRDQEIGRRRAVVERRGAQRFRIPVAVEVRHGPKATEPGFMHSKTLDVSSGGVYLRSNQRLEVGTQVALSLTLPTSAFGAIVDCKARIVRVEQYSDAIGGRFGIAIAIDVYNFVRPKSNS